MLRHLATSATVWILAVAATAGTALAQRPPAQGQGTGQFSIERAWNWLMARPGVIIAILIMVVAIGYLIVTRRRSRT